MTTKNIAVIGSGISGLSASWLLSKKHNITLYETNNYAGGHANTVDVTIDDAKVAVDTGFIVFNQGNYPNLTALFDHLNIPTHETSMTFAMSLDKGNYEYSGTGLSGFFGQRRNVFRPKHWTLLKDIMRFFKTAPTQLSNYGEDISLGDFLRAENYSRFFIDEHIIPMGAAIWSTDAEDMLDFPASSFITFYDNHGLLQATGQPLWRTVIGGSRTYVNKLLADSSLTIKRECAAQKITRNPIAVEVTDANGETKSYDDVIIAIHADQALNLLDAPTPFESNLLSQFTYQKNIAVLHRDKSLMPKRKAVWSSWNYLMNWQDKNAKLCVTYWMNSLQKLNTSADLFVTLNPNQEISEPAILRSFEYEHPLFNQEAVTAQQSLWDLQGKNRTWFCGSYFGYGFHEDGIQSGLAVAEQLGNLRRPWEVPNESGRITITKATSTKVAA